MQYRPLPDPPQSPPRSDTSGEYLTFEIERRILTLKFGVKVCRFVLLIEHSNHDSEKHGNDRHEAAPYRPPPARQPKLRTLCVQSAAASLSNDYSEALS
jgi:hypothetical protein